MFPFITKTWNPVTGCSHGCVYCWARKLACTKLAKTEKYKDGFFPSIWPKEFVRHFKMGDFVFVCDMGDLFCEGVWEKWVKQVFAKIGEEPARFLLLTKNPARYFAYEIPENCVCGATIETDIIHTYSNAPNSMQRIRAMQRLQFPRKMVSVEPIIDFNEPFFAEELIKIKPDFVAVGYDNYHNGLREPSFEKTMRLIEKLENAGIEVYRKTLREPFLSEGSFAKENSLVGEQC